MEAETTCAEPLVPTQDLGMRNRVKWGWVMPAFLILSGLFLNQWLLHPVLVLDDNTRSALRLAIVWVYDVVAVTSGLLLLVRRNKTSFSLRTFCYSGFLLLLMVIGMEVALDAIVWIVPSLDKMLSLVPVHQALPDPQYGMIPNPRYPGHDANGFRNPIALTQADWVTIGDSFTYGGSVRPDQSWTSLLQRHTGRSIYNMAFDGYGPIEELMLLKRAVDLRPSLVICAMFFGNDAHDAYRSVYHRNQFPEFKTQDADLQKAILDREREDPLKITASPQDSLSPLSRNTKWTVVKRLKLLRLFFAAETAIQGNVNGIAGSHYLKYRTQRRLAEAHSEEYELFETPELVTILVPANRCRGVNLGDPRIVEGLRITHQALLEMNTIVQSHGIEFLVLLIPTKERVCYELFSAYNHTVSEAMNRLVNLEDEVRRRNLDFLNERNIPHIDLFPSLKNSLANGERPYFMDHDTHFNPAGNRVVADVVEQYLKKKI
jgi:lysophospholipase L1-like esterase